MERKEIIERLNEIKRVVDSNSLEELIEAYPDAAGFSLCKESTFISIVGISSFLVNKHFNTSYVVIKHLLKFLWIFT